jgi:hypothetical protein
METSELFHDETEALDAAVLDALDRLDDGGWGDALGTFTDASSRPQPAAPSSDAWTPSGEDAQHGEDVYAKPGAGWDVSDDRQGGGSGGGGVPQAVGAPGNALAAPTGGPGTSSSRPGGPRSIAPSASVPLKFFAKRGRNQERDEDDGEAAGVSDVDEDEEGDANGAGPQHEHRGVGRAYEDDTHARVAALEEIWAAEAAAHQAALDAATPSPSRPATPSGAAITAAWKAQAAAQVSAGADEHSRLVSLKTPEPPASPVPGTAAAAAASARYAGQRGQIPPRPSSVASSSGLSSLHDGGDAVRGGPASVAAVPLDMHAARSAWEQTRGPAPAEGLLDDEDSDQGGQQQQQPKPGRGGRNRRSGWNDDDGASAAQQSQVSWLGGVQPAEVLHRALVTPTAPADEGPKEYTTAEVALPPPDLVGDLTQVPGVLLEAGTRLVAALREGIDHDLVEQRRAAVDTVTRFVIALGGSSQSESMDGASLRRRRSAGTPQDGMSPEPQSPGAPLSPMAVEPAQLSGWQHALLDAVHSLESSVESHHAAAAAACRAMESDALRVSLAMQDTGGRRNAAALAAEKTLLQRWLETAFGSKAAYDQWLHTVAASLCLTPDSRRGCLAVLKSLEPMRRQAISRRKAALIADVAIEREVIASRGGTPPLFRPSSAASGGGGRPPSAAPSGAHSARSTGVDPLTAEYYQQQPNGGEGDSVVGDRRGASQRGSRPMSAMSRQQQQRYGAGHGDSAGAGDEEDLVDDTRGIVLERLPGLTDEDLERMAEFLGSDVGSVWGDTADKDDDASSLADRPAPGMPASPIQGRPPVDDATYAAAQRVARMVAEARAAAALREQQRAAKQTVTAMWPPGAQPRETVKSGEAATSPTASQAHAGNSFFVPSARSAASSRAQSPAISAGHAPSTAAPPSAGVASVMAGMYKHDTWLQPQAQSQPPPPPSIAAQRVSAALGADAASLAGQRPPPPDRSVAASQRKPAPPPAAGSTRAPVSSAGGSSRATGRINITSDEEDEPTGKARQAPRAANAPPGGGSDASSTGGWGFDKTEALRRRGVSPPFLGSTSSKPGGGGVGAVPSGAAQGAGVTTALGSMLRSFIGSKVGDPGASDSGHSSSVQQRAARRARRAAQLDAARGGGLAARGAGAGWDQSALMRVFGLAAQAFGAMVAIALVALVLVMVLF